MDNGQNIFKNNHKTRWIWSWIPGSCKQEKVVEAATRRSPRMDAASVNHRGANHRDGSSVASAAVRNPPR